MNPSTPPRTNNRNNLKPPMHPRKPEALHLTHLTNERAPPPDAVLLPEDTRPERVSLMGLLHRHQLCDCWAPVWVLQRVRCSRLCYLQKKRLISKNQLTSNVIKNLHTHLLQVPRTPSPNPKKQHPMLEIKQQKAPVTPKRARATRHLHKMPFLLIRPQRNE